MESHLFFTEDLNNHHQQLYLRHSQQHLLSSHPLIRNKDHLYNLICISILPHAYSNLEPLCVGSMGAIYLTREEYKTAEFDEQDWITLEMCLSIASEIRKKMILISSFLQQNSSRPYFVQHHCVKPIKDVLQNFIEGITESVQRKRSTFKDPWELLNFLTNYTKQIEPIFSTFQNLLSSLSVLNMNDILNFWNCFLQEKINLWDYNKLLKWQEELFEGFVYLLAKCILDELSSTPAINFLTFFVEYDHYIPNMLSFLHRCLILMPKNMRDSLPLFDDIFIKFWENAKEKKCIRYTSTFLSILIRQSLDKFSKEVNSIVLAELHSSHVILSSHLQHIKQFYSLNTHSLGNLLKNSGCVPPFEDFSKNPTKWSIVEEEVRKRLGCVNTNEDYVNTFYKIQHWSISVFLTPNIYKSLDYIFLRLYKIIHSWHTIMNYSNNLKTKRNTLIFTFNLKTQIRRRLSLKIIHFLQIIIQAILGQFTTINDFYIKKLLDQMESSDILLQRLIEITKEWNECLESLFFFINDTLFEPLDEIVKIVNEFVEISPEFNKIADRIEINVNNDEDDDNDVKKYLSLQYRLQRVYLFTINVEYEGTKGSEQIFLNDERSPQTKDSLFLIKMMLST
ncbi:hypothetical protein ACQ4LE_009638 [Meloidogyne hapla]